MTGSFKRLWGYLAVLLSACFFALVSTLTKVAYSLGMTPLQVLTLQSCTAFLILLAYSLVFSPRSLRIARDMLPRLAVQSIIGGLGTSTLFLYALKYLPASFSTMLLFTYPVLVTLGAYVFLQQKVLRVQLIAVGIAAGGTMLSTQFWLLASRSLNWTGILFGLGSAIAYSFFILYGENILQRIEPLTTLIYMQLFSALVLVLVQLPGYTLQGIPLTVNWVQFFIGVSLATIASILPFWLLLEGIRRIGASKAAVLGTFELPVAFLFAYIFLGERFGVYQLAGAILITASVVILRITDLDSPEVKSHR